MKRNRNCILLSILSITFTIEADNLLDIYNEALENDPQFKAAEYTYLSGKEIKKQGMAALLPSISLSGQTTWNEYYQLGELQNEYNSFSQAARISLSLIHI